MKDLIDLARDINTRHVTFITHRNRILVIGKNNRTKTHTLAKKWGYKRENIHSELDAILKFPRTGKRLKDCVIWNLRIDCRGKVRNSRPCNNCRNLLYAFGASRIYYSNDSGEFVRLRVGDTCKEY